MIQFANPKSENLQYKSDFIEIFSKFLTDDSFILGDSVENFEKAFSIFNDTKFSVGLNSGTDALIVALRALGAKEGDEVIIPNLSALATMSAVLQSHATPVLVDVDNKGLLDIASLMNSITKKTKIIILVNLFGDCSKAKEIKKICDENNLYLIEDCAQSCGSMIDGRRAGFYGDISAHSFYPTKNLAALGDGGALTTNNLDFYEFSKKYRQYGWNEYREPDHVGINSRLDVIQAKILLFKLHKLDSHLDARKRICKIFIDRLHDKFTIVTNSKQIGYHLFVIEVDNRKGFIEHMNKNGINPGIHYKTPFSKTNIYNELSKSYVSLCTSERLSERVVSLPLYSTMDDSTIDKVIDACLSF